MAEDKRQHEIIRIQKKRNNFVMMDKGFLNDERLSFKAKGILAYLLSKPDQWQVIVKDLIHRSTDGRDSVYAGLKELKACGYYKKTPVRNEKGVVMHWDSIIFEDPEENPENRASYPLPAFPDTAKPDTAKPDTENPEHSNNNISNKDFIKHVLTSASMSTSVSGSKSKPDGHGPDADGSSGVPAQIKDKEKKEEPVSNPPDQRRETQGPKENTSQAYYDTCLQRIQAQIAYEYFLHNRPEDIALVDELINVMLDVMCTEGDTVHIGGEVKSRRMVISQYLKLNEMDIEHLLDRYCEQRHKIRHVHAYLRTMLYTVKQESQHYYANRVSANRGVVR